MTECPVCGEKIQEEGVCPECGFDMSMYYEKYPTLHADIGKKVMPVSYYKEEYKKNNPEGVFICSACGGRRFMYAESDNTLICCKCHEKYIQESNGGAGDHYSEGMAPLDRLTWELRKKFYKINEEDTIIIRVFKDNIITVAQNGKVEVYDKQNIPLNKTGSLGFSFSINNTKYVTKYCNDIILIGFDKTVFVIGNDRVSQYVKEWTGIVDISSSSRYVLGLKDDNSIVVAGNPPFNYSKIQGLKDVISVTAGEEHAVFIRKNGTVVALGPNQYGQCETESWRNIIAVSAGDTYTLGLRSDGSVLSTKIKGSAGDFGQTETADLKDIVAISAGRNHSVFLNTNGQVTVKGDNSKGQGEVSRFYDIIAISAYGDITAGLRADGKVLKCGI